MKKGKKLGPSKNGKSRKRINSPKSDAIIVGFWEKYYGMDMLEREEKVKNIVNSVLNISTAKKMDKKMKNKILSSLLCSYFDDLINYMESKNEKN